jgi:rod shape-determining protein MreC
LLSTLALALLLVNFYRADWVAPARAWLINLAQPFYWVSDLPVRMAEWGTEAVQTRDHLQRENESLRTELLVHKRKLQQMASLAAENVRLRQLLNSAEMIQDDVLVAELVGVSPDPMAHKIIINRGSVHGVFVGQPLLDASGLMGQVVEVGANVSQVLLITDSTHALPVQINRNGVRAIAEGVGDLHELKLRHVPNTVDIREGDLLVSSGLGGGFPAGYPVATVTSVVHDPGKPFATVMARPSAELNRSRHVLLVFSAKSEDRPDILPAPAVEAVPAPTGAR